MSGGGRRGSPLGRVIIALLVVAVALWLGSLRDGDDAPADAGRGVPVHAEV